MLLIASAVLAAIVGPGAWGAAAASGDVHFDPSSPAGQEYALPLERAREEAAGTQGQSDSDGEGAALFGAGVSGGGPRGSVPAGAEHQADGGAEEGSSEAGAAQGEVGRTSPNGGPASTSVHLSQAGGGFPLMMGVAMVAALLLAVAILGMVMRRLPSGATH